MRAIDYFDKGADAYADRTAIVDGEARYTYKEMRGFTHQIARAMWAAGLRDEERAALFSPNDPRVLFCMLGILRAGAVWVPINSRNALEANIEYMKYVEVSWLFYHSSYRDSVHEIRLRVSSLRNCVCIDAEDGTNPSLDQFMKNGVAGQEIDWGDPYGNPDRLMGLVPTGGTTGAAKGVMVTDLAWGTMTEMATHYWAGNTAGRVCLTRRAWWHL
jgi:fatty-acyl-CoA synthase